MSKNNSVRGKKARERGSVFAAAALALAPLMSSAGGQPDAKSTAPRPLAKKKEEKEKSLLTFLDGRLILDIEERARGEVRENNRDSDSSVNDDNGDTRLLNRFRFSLAVKPVSWLKLNGQTQNSREASSDHANLPSAPATLPVRKSI